MDVNFKDEQCDRLSNRHNRTKQFELEYRAMLDKAIKRVDKYNQNMFKAYAFLWKNVAVLYKIKLQKEAILIKKKFNDEL